MRGFDVPLEQREAGEEAEQDRLQRLADSRGSMSFGDWMRALGAMPGVPDHPCDECCGTGARPVRCCDGRECGCYGQPVEYRECDCGMPFPTEAQLRPFVPKRNDCESCGSTHPVEQSCPDL